MDKLMRLNTALNHLVWGKYMIFLLLFCGFWLFIRTGFFTSSSWNFDYEKDDRFFNFHKVKRKESHLFQAVSTALAGTLGVGSVIGVTTAITLGGPGAILWMCVSAFLV